MLCTCLYPIPAFKVLWCIHLILEFAGTFAREEVYELNLQQYRRIRILMLKKLNQQSIVLYLFGTLDLVIVLDYAPSLIQSFGGSFNFATGLSRLFSTLILFLHITILLCLASAVLFFLKKPASRIINFVLLPFRLIFSIPSFYALLLLQTPLSIQYGAPSYFILIALVAVLEAYKTIWLFRHKHFSAGR